jgi:hypothetical protein
MRHVRLDVDRREPSDKVSAFRRPDRALRRYRREHRDDRIRVEDVALVDDLESQSAHLVHARLFELMRFATAARLHRPSECMAIVARGAACENGHRPKAMPVHPPLGARESYTPSR